MGKENFRGVRAEELFPVTRKYKELTLEELINLEMRPSQFYPVMIDIVEKIVDKKEARDLLRQYEESRFAKPCQLSQREIIDLEHKLYQCLPGNCQDIELAPVAPLGANSVLTEVSQKRILATVRGFEVIADPTTILALECARRRRSEGKSSSNREFVIDLCTSARCTRCQLFSEESGFTPHFQVFTLASGGIRNDGTMEKKMFEHISFFLNFFEQIRNKEDKYSIKDIKLQISNINIAEALMSSMALDRVSLGRDWQEDEFSLFSALDITLPGVITSLDQLDYTKAGEYGIIKHVNQLRGSQKAVGFLREEHPGVQIEFDLERVAGLGYYNGLCFKISASNRSGHKYPLVDGGYSDWLGELLSNRKVIFCSSGFGLELFGKFFK